MINPNLIRRLFSQYRWKSLIVTAVVRLNLCAYLRRPMLLLRFMEAYVFLKIASATARGETQYDLIAVMGITFTWRKSRSRMLICWTCRTTLSKPEKTWNAFKCTSLSKNQHLCPKWAWAISKKLGARSALSTTSSAPQSAAKAVWEQSVVFIPLTSYFAVPRASISFQFRTIANLALLLSAVLLASEVNASNNVSKPKRKKNKGAFSYRKNRKISLTRLRSSTEKNAASTCLRKISIDSLKILINNTWTH